MKVNQKYFEKLNISILSIDKIKELIEENIINTINCWNKNIFIEKQTFHIIGPAGVGKTQICTQIASSLSKKLDINFQIMPIKSPVLSRDDLIIPFPVVKDGSPSFKMLYSEFVPKDENSYGIFVIDELNRGDHNFQQLMWQIQNEYKLHLKEFPKGWFVISLDNPDDQEYSMNTLYDAAGLRRCLHLYTDISVEAFLKHALANNFHSLVTDFIQIHPDYLYDFDSQKIGAVYANPASWERVSNILWGYSYNEETDIYKNLFKIESLVSGLLNTSMAKLFIDYIRDKDEIDPKIIFNNYESVRKEILQLNKTSNVIKLGKITQAFITYITVYKPEFSQDSKNLLGIGLFLSDIPQDIAAILIRKMDSFNKNSEEFLYFTKLHVALTKKSISYKEQFVEIMTRLGEKAKQTA